MNSVALISGLIPLIIFVILDTFSTTKSALIGAVVFACLELVLTLYFFREIDSVTLFSFSMVLLFSIISYRKKNKLWFKFQPVILSWFIGLYCIITYYIGAPIIYEMAMKYQNIVPVNLKYQLLNPMFQLLLQKATMTVGFSLIIHGVFTAIFAIKLSNVWWLIMRGVGFYIFMYLGLIWAKYIIVLGG